MSRPPCPPFTEETARQKVRAAEDAWNTRDAAKVALAYTPDSRWRNRVEFPTGREQIEAFLVRKWQGELDYREEEGGGPPARVPLQNHLPTAGKRRGRC